MTIQYYKVLLMLLLLSILSGCSGGSSDKETVDEEPAATESPAEDPPAEDPPSEDPPAEEPPAEEPPATPGAAQDFTLIFEATKIFRFDWTDAEGATHYHLLENPDGNSGFSPVAENIPQGSGTLALEVPLFARTNAQYLLRACNSDGEKEQCSDSDLLSVSDSLAASIGYFKASNTDPRDAFGFSISLSADGLILAVGADREDSDATGTNGNQSDNSAKDSGAVYVFTRVNGAWEQQAYLKSSNTNAGEQFGSSVSLSADGRTLAVGANAGDFAAFGFASDQSENGADYAGTVYIFTQEDGVWTQQAYLKASNADTFDRFGTSVSLSADGDTLAVGADSEDSGATGTNGEQDDNSAENSGAVYVFSREDEAWLQQAYIKASNTDLGDFFGATVSLSADGQTLAVGANHESSSSSDINGDQSDNSASAAGAVYVFSQSEGSWVQQAYVKASNTDARDFFGTSVSLSADGHTLAVGAFFEDSNAIGIDGDQADNSAIDSGAVYVFARVNDAWEQQAYLKASNTEETNLGSGDSFGGSISISADGNTLAVGADREESSATGANGDQLNNEATFAGAAYVFIRVNEAWVQQAYLKASNTEALDFFGSFVSLSADGNTLAVVADSEDSSATGINGDQADNSAEWSGAIYVY
ncbi:histidine kinase [Microbulbifer sp. TRSA007]|uniref:histidine kinase n=1 Tax=Microbulbifer sp. TRSA007 TaxID=3243384 RepID=UPI004039C102